MKTTPTIAETFRQVLENPNDLPPAAQAYALTQALLAVDALAMRLANLRGSKVMPRSAEAYLSAHGRLRDYATSLAVYFEGDATLSGTWKARRRAENALTKIDASYTTMRTVAAGLEALLLVNEVAEPVTRIPDAQKSHLIYTLGADCLEAFACDNAMGEIPYSGLYKSQVLAVRKAAMKALRRSMQGRDPKRAAWDEETRQRMRRAIEFGRDRTSAMCSLHRRLNDILLGLVLAQKEFTNKSLDVAALEVAQMGHFRPGEYFTTFVRPLTAVVRGYLMGFGDTTGDDPQEILSSLDSIEAQMTLLRIEAESNAYEVKPFSEADPA